MNNYQKKWKFAVDRGGTFTDIVAVDPSGNFHAAKLLSRSAAYGDASIEGIKRVLGLNAGDPLPDKNIEGIKLGTTMATNALLERKGCRVALIVTKGFRDLLEIGYQDRPDIFSLCIEKPLPVYARIIEIEERTNCRGRPVIVPDRKKVRAAAVEIGNEDIDATAVVLMHSWINPSHELLCEQILNDEGVSRVFLSHRTENRIKIISRGQSTVADAYLSKVIGEYVRELRNAAGAIPIEFMQSSGATTPSESFSGRNALLSGPAGGVIAVAGIAAEKNLKGAIGFDMGGTSTDVSRFGGRLEKIFEQNIGGLRLQAEALDIATVAAGGGSVLDFDGRRMTAGPESAGAYPGPACYGFGGPLTITDANLMAGRIIPEYFPATFGRDGKSALDQGIVKEKFLSMAERINLTAGAGFSAGDVAYGFLRVANEKMAMAIKGISVSRGFDVRDDALVCFGGAGGQHACGIAALLDMETVIIHPLCSVMSAYGIGLSKPEWKNERTILKVFDKYFHAECDAIFKTMKDELLEKIPSGTRSFTEKYELDLRPAGAGTFLTLAYGDFHGTVEAFRNEYKRLFGFSPSGTDIEVFNVRVKIRDISEFLPPYREDYAMSTIAPVPEFFRQVRFTEGSMKTPVYARKSLAPSFSVKGPAVIVDHNTTIVVDPGFDAEVDHKGIITIRRTGKKTSYAAGNTVKPDPVLLEVFYNLFTGTAAEMGLALKKTAFSVNMKERLDFSCAVFDPDGGLVANAPHIPVHLGSMADTVRNVLEDRRGIMRPGDMFLTNNPYRGGSHLPDMTVVCPVFSKEDEIIFFTAARGHHSDAGGTVPGSMPPVASRIEEEGVLIDGFLLVRNGKFMENELKSLLVEHRYPVRNVQECIHDFRAQAAACIRGISEINRIVSKYGLDTVQAYMGHIQDNAGYSVKRALQMFLGKKNEFKSSFEDRLDDGSVIKVSVIIRGGSAPPDTLRAVIDFTGTGPQHVNDNLNAPLSVVRSAVMYVLRALTESEIPLNSGSLSPVDIIIPPKTVLSPEFPAPVATGNVETSQRVVDVLLGAFGIAGASQGTMNNLLFEVAGESPYYETIAGGAGAMDGCPGASAVQVHMTNTRTTDPEVLEFRHPGIRIEQFIKRTGSGGQGRYRGGDGVVREIRFLKPASVSILSERRVYSPYGMKGGKAGEKGVNMLKKADGDVAELGHRETIHVNINDSVIIKTPGGGGYETERDF